MIPFWLKLLELYGETKPQYICIRCFTTGFDRYYRTYLFEDPTHGNSFHGEEQYLKVSRFVKNMLVPSKFPCHNA